MADVEQPVGELPIAGSKPVDAAYIMHTSLDLANPEKLIPDAEMFAGYSRDDAAATLQNKLIGSTNVIGEAGNQPPIIASEVTIGASGSRCTWLKYARAAVVIPAISDGALASVDVTVTGALTTDMVAVGWAAVVDELTLQVYVQGANTVRFRFCNRSGGGYAGATVSFDILILRMTA